MGVALVAIGVVLGRSQRVASRSDRFPGRRSMSPKPIVPRGRRRLPL